MSQGSDETVSYTISVEDFDKSLLPPHARTPGTDAFSAEVSKIIAADFGNLGGRVRIVVDERLIQVHYRRDPNEPSLVDRAIQKLAEGEYDLGVRLLRMLLSSHPDHPDILYNLGMALSDMGHPEEAETHLRRVLELDPQHANARIALGVALVGQGSIEEAIDELRRAVEQAPDNSYAHRNLGGCLTKSGNLTEAVKHLRRATELNTHDQQAWFGLAQALDGTGDEAAADEALIRVIEIDSRNQIAEMARQQRTRYAHESFRDKAGGGPRMDAVMYMLDAIQQFEKMTDTQIKQVGVEIAILGQRGIDMNDPAQKYQLRSLSGSFSGLHLLCLMYAAFEITAPGQGIGMDLSKEYEVAQAMRSKK